MAIESLDLNKNYSIKLSDIYGGMKYNLQVIGTTNIDAVSKNDDKYNIFSTFFEPVGLGIGSYYTAISTVTKIYIFVVIDSLEPFELSTDKMFIPETLINFNKSQEYIKVYNMSYNIYPIIKRINTDDELEKYIEETRQKIASKLQTFIDFSLNDLNIEAGYDSVYIPKETMDAIENDREIMFGKYMDRERLNIRTTQERDFSFSSKMRELDLEIIKSHNLQDDYRAKIARLQQLIQQYEEWVSSN